MVELARHQHVEQTVVVHVADGDVLGRGRLLAPGQGDAGPAVGIVAPEVEPNVVAVLMDGDDVQVSIAVEVGHFQAVGAAQRDAAGEFLVVDAVLTPGDELAARGLCRRGCLGHRERPAGSRRVDGVRTGGSTAGQERERPQQDAERPTGRSGLRLRPLARCVRRSRDAHASLPTPRGNSRHW